MHFVALFALVAAAFLGIAAAADPRLHNLPKELQQEIARKLDRQAFKNLILAAKPVYNSVEGDLETKRRVLINTYGDMALAYAIRNGLGGDESLLESLIPLDLPPDQRVVVFAATLTESLQIFRRGLRQLKILNQQELSLYDTVLPADVGPWHERLDSIKKAREQARSKIHATMRQSTWIKHHARSPIPERLVLTMAIAYNYASVTKYYVDERRIDVNSVGHNRLTPLATAALHGQRELAAYLLRRGAVINLCSGKVQHWDADAMGTDDAADKLATPLTFAVAGNHAHLVQLLARRGADLNGVCSNINNRHLSLTPSPLKIAALMGNLEMVQLLLNLGAAPHPIGETRPALYIAMAKDHNSIVDDLLQLGNSSPWVMDAVRLFLRPGGIGSVKYFFEHGVAVNNRDSLGRTPLMNLFVSDAFKRHREDGHRRQLFEYLLSKKASVNDMDSRGVTVGMLAARVADLSLVMRLEACGLSWMPKDSDSMNALSHAILQQNWDAVDYLMDRGVELLPTIRSGQAFCGVISALVLSNDQDLVQGALDIDMNVNEVSSTGHTALEFAKMLRNDDIARLLLKRGAVPSTTVIGMLPAHNVLALASPWMCLDGNVVTQLRLSHSDDGIHGIAVRCGSGPFSPYFGNEVGDERLTMEYSADGIRHLRIGTNANEQLSFIAYGKSVFGTEPPTTHDPFTHSVDGNAFSCLEPPRPLMTNRLIMVESPTNPDCVINGVIAWQSASALLAVKFTFSC